MQNLQKKYKEQCRACSTPVSLETPRACVKLCGVMVTRNAHCRASQGEPAVQSVPLCHSISTCGRYYSIVTKMVCKLVGMFARQFCTGPWWQHDTGSV